MSREKVLSKGLAISVAVIVAAGAAGVVLMLLGLTSYGYLMMLVVFAVPMVRIFGGLPRLFGRQWPWLVAIIWLVALVVVVGIFLTLLSLHTGNGWAAVGWGTLSAAALILAILGFWRWDKRNETFPRQAKESP